MGYIKKKNDIPKLYISENSHMVPLDKYCSIYIPENSYKINKINKIEYIYTVLFVYGWSFIFVMEDPGGS